MLLNGEALIMQRKAFSENANPEGTGFHDRIVVLRKERGLTLQECARLTGVAASTLSKIERAELSPTVSTLQKIAAGFGLEVADLLTRCSSPGSRHNRRDVSRAGAGKMYGSLSCKNFLLCHNLKNKRMIPVRTCITARSTDEYPVWASSEAEVFLWVVSGQMLLHTKTYEPVKLGPGDSIYYDSNDEHCWTSVGDDDAEVIWILTA